MNEGTAGSRHFAAVLIPALLGVSTPAYSQVCGDANRNGVVTVTDGVLVLAFAAGLASDCGVSIGTCDVDETGTVTVTDGVQVLRRAAGLPNDCQGPTPSETPRPTPMPSTVAAPSPSPATRTDEVLAGVTRSLRIAQGSISATLNLGIAPLPNPDAGVTIGPLPPRSLAVPGSTTSYEIQYGSSLQRAMPSNAGLSLIFALVSSSGVPLIGFFELPVDPGETAAFIGASFVKELAELAYELRVASNDNGVISQYVNIPLDVRSDTTVAGLPFGVGTYTDRDFGVLGTSILYNPSTFSGLLSYIDVSGARGWNGNQSFAFGIYQPPGTHPDKALSWIFVPPVDGAYVARGITGDQKFSGQADLSSSSTLSTPAISVISADSFNDTVNVDWTFDGAAGSALVRVNEIPFQGLSSILGERVVSGAVRSALLTDVAIEAGRSYQAVVFVFSDDVRRDTTIPTLFNIGADGEVFVAPFG